MNFIDHVHEAWCRLLTAGNAKYDDEKSPAGKTGYHSIGACVDVIQ